MRQKTFIFKKNGIFDTEEIDDWIWQMMDRTLETESNIANYLTKKKVRIKVSIEWEKK